MATAENLDGENQYEQKGISGTPIRKDIKKLLLWWLNHLKNNRLQILWEIMGVASPIYNQYNDTMTGADK